MKTFASKKYFCIFYRLLALTGVTFKISFSTLDLDNKLGLSRKTTGLNFINVLRTAFAPTDNKKAARATYIHKS
jgi:hypothetical protein